MAYVVYQGGADDVPELVGLLNGSFHDGQSSDAEILHQQIAVGTFLCLREDDDLIGCVFLRAVDGWAELDSLSVAGARRALGFGTLLLERAEAWARRRALQGVRLNVLSPRAELLEWYERRGYRRGAPAVPAVELTKDFA